MTAGMPGAGSDPSAAPRIGILVQGPLDKGLFRDAECLAWALQRPPVRRAGKVPGALSVFFVRSYAMLDAALAQVHLPSSSRGCTASAHKAPAAPHGTSAPPTLTLPGAGSAVRRRQGWTHLLHRCASPMQRGAAHCYIVRSAVSCTAPPPPLEPFLPPLSRRRRGRC